MGKTYALEACLWALCGMSDESKADPDMDTRTIKASAGMTTNPIPVDDGESTKKVVDTYLIPSCTPLWCLAKLAFVVA